MQRTTGATGDESRRVASDRTELVPLPAFTLEEVALELCWEGIAVTRLRLPMPTYRLDVGFPALIPAASAFGYTWLRPAE